MVWLTVRRITSLIWVLKELNLWVDRLQFAPYIVIPFFEQLDISIFNYNIDTCRVTQCMNKMPYQCINFLLRELECFWMNRSPKILGKWVLKIHTKKLDCLISMFGQISAWDLSKFSLKWIVVLKLVEIICKFPSSDNSYCFGSNPL